MLLKLSSFSGSCYVFKTIFLTVNGNQRETKIQNICTVRKQEWKCSAVNFKLELMLLLWNSNKLADYL